MLFLLLNIILLLCVILLVFVLSMVWPPDSPWAPFWATKPPTARVMCHLAKVNDKTIVYDLGCGTGTAVCVAAKEYNAHCVGIEIDPMRFAISWMKVHLFFRISDNVKLIRENFFNVPLHDADVFFIYLIPHALERLTPKFLKEVKTGALFISYVYPMPLDLFKGRLKFLEHDEVHRIFMYKMI